MAHDAALFMVFSFTAKIFKVGINPCVDVPVHVTNRMKSVKGYIPVKGTINGHLFTQTLVTVKDAPFRLYVNGPMLKGSGTGIADVVGITLEQNFLPVVYTMPKQLKKQLQAKKLLETFNKLTPGRQKEILRYLGSLKTNEAKERNIAKVIEQLGSN